MKLKYILQQLTVGEFSQVNFGSGPGVIDEKSYTTLMAHLNLALSALYKRFKIKEGMVNVKLNKDVSEYTLHSKHSFLTPTLPGIPKYLLDTPGNPFINNANKIERIVSMQGADFPFNIPGNKFSFDLLSLNTFRMPPAIFGEQSALNEVYKGDVVTVYYRVGHTPLMDRTVFVEPEVTEIDIPDIYVEALLYFIASRVHNPIGLTNEFHEGNNYAAKYEAECQRLEAAGLQMNDSLDLGRFVRNGWV